MNFTQNTISELNTYAKRFVRGREDLTTEDIVQDVLLSCLESGVTSIDKIKDEIKKRACNERTYKTKDSPNAFSEVEVSRYCKCCKEDLPIAMFFIFRYKDVRKKAIISQFCKSCTNHQTHLRWRKKHPIPRANKKYFTPEEKAEAKRRLSKERYIRQMAAKSKLDNAFKHCGLIIRRKKVAIPDGSREEAISEIVSLKMMVKKIKSTVKNLKHARHSTTKESLIRRA